MYNKLRKCKTTHYALISLNYLKTYVHGYHKRLPNSLQFTLYLSRYINLLPTKKKKKKREKGVKKRENGIPFEAYESRIQKRSINITDKKKKVGAKKGGKKISEIGSNIAMNLEQI